jgi:cell division protein FtsZ
MTIEMIQTEEFNQGTQIKVIGVGGGGGNAVEHMIVSEVQGVEFICANTDAQALARSAAHRFVQLGQTGLGAGSKPDKGREAAEAAESEIRAAITGAAPVIAKIAKDMGILTVGVVTKPFDFEGKRRMTNADEGMRELEANVDSLIVVLNEKLLELPGGEDMTQDEAFSHANDVLKNAVGGIAEIINVPGHVNVDFEDVRTVMGEPGKAMMGTAAASGPDRARIAAEQAVACPLLEGVDLKGARGVLVLISAAKGSLKLSESKQAMNTIRDCASEEAHVIYGTAYDESLGDQIRVTVVATGLAKAGAVRPELKVLRTGTDNVPFMMGGQDAVSAPLNSAASLGASGMNTPAIWRSNRTHAAARVDGMANAGMDDIEIPAFLRKQAD